MTTVLPHTWFLSVRLLRQATRQPWWIAISMVQPFIWLVLYGQLFRSVVQIPGFGSASYITFLTPGIVVMSALYNAGWSGMGVIDDLDRGVIDRFLVATASRIAVVSGRLLTMAIITIVQSLCVILLGTVLGARYPGGLTGVFVLLLSALLLAIPIGALSTSLALTIRRRESVIAASNFLLVPMVFLSPVFMAENLMPGWVRTVAQFSPVTWAVDAARHALQEAETDWTGLLFRLLPLIILDIVCAALAVYSFRSYQRSV